MPAEFRYQEPDVDYWMPLYVGPQPDAGARLFGVRARLKPGVSLAQAQAELDAIAAQLAAEQPVQNKGWGVRVRPLNEFLFGWTREPLLTLEAAVALVLLIGCANVAALLLSRASVRQREVALRVALGAGRGRIIRQLLTESVLLAIAGGALGLVVAVLGQRALTSMTTPPGFAAAHGDWFEHACLRAARAAHDRHRTRVRARARPFAARGSIRSARSRSRVRRRRRLAAGVFPQGVLVSVQLALALVLLIGSGLLLNSLVRQVRRDLNFDPDGLVRARLRRAGGSLRATHRHVSAASRTSRSRRRRRRQLERVLERLRAVPGAESVAGISAPPVDSFVLATMEVSWRRNACDDASSRPTTSATYFLVTPNLFATLRTPIVHGRDFTDRDIATTPWVAIVNETCARRFWPGEDPIGKRLTLDTVPEEQPREVIGVVRDIPTRHAATIRSR